MEQSTVMSQCKTGFIVLMEMILMDGCSVELGAGGGLVGYAPAPSRILHYCRMS